MHVRARETFVSDARASDSLKKYTGRKNKGDDVRRRPAARAHEASGVAESSGEKERYTWDKSPTRRLSSGSGRPGLSQHEGHERRRSNAYHNSHSSSSKSLNLNGPVFEMAMANGMEPMSSAASFM